MPTARSTANAESVATHLKTLLGHDQIVVRPHGRHLHIRLQEDGLETTVARLTEMQSATFAAAHCNHAGRWEPLPGTGDLIEAAQIVVDCLGPYLNPTLDS